MTTAGIDAVGLLEAHGAHYTLSGTWVNFQCPLCGDAGEHGGINLEGAYYHCWRCGGHQLEYVLSRAFGLSRREAERLIGEHTGGVYTAPKSTTHAQSLQLPGGGLGKYHRQYLERRGFDPDYLVQEYGIRGTSPFERWEGMDYGARVIIPVYDSIGELVSFQGRTIHPMEQVRYKACPKEKGVMDIKHCIYNAHRVPGDRVLVVEGAFDVWRLGAGAVGVLGVSVSRAQIRALSRWREVLIAFDSGAEERAERLGVELAGMGVATVEVVDLCLRDRDIGDLSDEEGEDIMRQLGFRGVASKKV